MSRSYENIHSKLSIRLSFIDHGILQVRLRVHPIADQLPQVQRPHLRVKDLDHDEEAAGEFGKCQENCRRLQQAWSIQAGARAASQEGGTGACNASQDGITAQQGPRIKQSCMEK